MQQEAANAELVRSHAAAVRADTRLRVVIVYLLCGLLSFTVTALLVMAVLQATGKLQKSDLLLSIGGPGGIVLALVAALAIILRRR